MLSTNRHFSCMWCLKQGQLSVWVFGRLVEGCLWDIIGITSSERNIDTVTTVTTNGAGWLTFFEFLHELNDNRYLRYTEQTSA